MAKVRGLTAERMEEIEASAITGGRVDAAKHLILTTHDGREIDAGKVEGPQGVPGMPPGTIAMWTSPSVPPGWIEADGRAVSRVTYSDLFAIIGSQYGNGDGANTFNVPDLRGKIVVGQDPGDAIFDTLNKQGGEKNHQLTEAEMPTHNHNFSYQGSTTYGGWPLLSDVDILGNVGFSVGTKWSPERPISISNRGGNAPHNNLQPYRVLKYIVKGVGGAGELTSTVESVLLDRVAATEVDIDTLQSNVSVAQQDIVKLKEMPSFQARMSASQSLSGATVWAKIEFGTQLVDRGNCYDIANSRFLARETGLYEFSFSVTPSTSTAGPGFGFRINGVATQPNFDVMGYYDAYKTVGATRQMLLNAGDYVEVWWTNNNATACTIHSGYGGLFSGRMI